MYIEAKINPLSKVQISKLLNGKLITMKHGSGLTVQLSPEQHKMLMRANLKGKGMRLRFDPFQNQAHMHLKGKGNITATSKDAGKNLIIAGSDRAVRAIEGSGVSMRGRNITSTSKDAGKNLIVAGSDRAVRAIEGSGSRDFNAKEAMQQIKQGRPFRKKDGTAPLSLQSISAGRPLGGKGVQSGKISRSKKFNKWFKDIGQKFLPINKNLKPIKDAATKRAAEYIETYNNPEAIAKSGLDMFQEELPQTLQAFKNQDYMPTVYAEQIPTSYPTFPMPPQLERSPVYNNKEDLIGFSNKPTYATPTDQMYYGFGLKKRGRPRKGGALMPAGQSPRYGGALMPAGGALHVAGGAIVKRKRGRPRKVKA